MIVIIRSDFSDIRFQTVFGTLIAYADKMANMTEMFYDYKIIKDELWKRFNRGKEKQYWYYLEFYKIFCYNELIDKEHLKEYEMLLNDLFQ